MLQTRFRKRLCLKTPQGSPGTPSENHQKLFWEVNFADVLGNIDIFVVGVLLDADPEKLKNHCFLINFSKCNALNML